MVCMQDHNTVEGDSGENPDAYYWSHGPVWSGRCPVTAEIAGSNPAVTASGKLSLGKLECAGIPPSR